MRMVVFCHSLVSDWNHGNAHFLRGVVRELRARGHGVRVYEPRGGWSRTNLLAERGEAAIRRFEAAFPGLRSVEYDVDRLDLDAGVAFLDLAGSGHDHATIAREVTDIRILDRQRRQDWGPATLEFGSVEVTSQR